MASATGPKAGIIDVNDLRYFARIFSKNWYFVVVALVLSAVLSYLYSYKIPDVYGASTQILLRDRETYNYQSAINQNIGYVAAYSDLVNQKRVLTSYDMIDRTLNKLDFDISYYNIGRLRTTQIYGKKKLPFVVTMEVLNAQLYDKPFDLHIIDADKFELSYDAGKGMIRKELPFNQDIPDPDFVLRVQRSPHVTAANVQKFSESDYRFIRHNRARLVAKYGRTISVENLEFTTILQVMAEDEIGRRAKMFLDTLSKMYINYTLRSEFEINENTIKYIDRQMDQISGTLNQYESEMQEFMLDKNILDLGREKEEYFNRLVDYDAQHRKLQLMVESVDALEDYVVNSGQEEMLPPSFYILDDDIFLKNLLTQLYSMQMESNNKLFDATPDNPAITKGDSVLQLHRANLLIYLKNTRTAIEQKMGDVTGQINDYNRLIRTVPQNQRGILDIQRRVKVNEKLYEFLLEKRASTVIARAGIVPQTKVIEEARVIGVVRPDKVKILYTFLVGGLLLSLVVVFIRVMFYDRIENAEQLRDATQLPVFGEIIASEKAEDNYVVVDSDPKSAITESFRTVRTNLEYLPATPQGKVVMVTSYRPNEGKTFCSVNLSAILAKASKKVLLLEMDLHKPKVGSGLGMESNVGLSNILVGKAEVADCIQPTRFPHFDVILSGPTPPNASELVLSERLETILRYGREHYDYVMIDTPPVGLITDALLMMRHVDATLFVVNTRFANKDHVRNTVEVQKSNLVKNFGIILNGVRMKKSKYYYNTNYGYGYRYAYGYGYGYGKRSEGRKSSNGPKSNQDN